MIRNTVCMLVLVLVSYSALPAWANHEAAQRAWDAGQTDEALVQWQKAAADGDRQAMHALGRLYLQGLGVLQDYVEAHKWLNLAASRGEAAAQAERDALAERMTPAQVAEAQALARAWRPSETETAPAAVEKAAAVEETAAAAEPASSVTSDDGPGAGPEPKCVSAEEGAACWTAPANRPGCHIWVDRYVPDETVAWAGLCSGGVITGKGTLVWTGDGKSRVWAGTATDGKRQGYWTGRLADGGIEEGSFVDSKRHGRWVTRFVDGGSAEGPFAEGKRHGYWVIRQPDGTMEGPYVDGKRHGHWVMRTSAGDVAEGPYVDGRKQGNWVESRADGSLWMGPYVDDKMHGRWHQTGEEECVFSDFNQDAVAGSGVLEPADCPSLDIATDDGGAVGGSDDGGPLTAAAEEPEAATPDERQADLAREKEERQRKEREARERAEAERKRLALKPGRVFRDCAECPEMVVVPAGPFMMGSPPGDRDSSDIDRPQHRVTIAAPFAVGKYEITFDEWDACVAAGGCGGYRPSDRGWGRGRRPVIHVSWDDAKAYVDWLARESGEPYRLLSEAEWEYAARAGTTTRYSWGDEIGRNRANCAACRSRSYNKQTVRVGSFPANRFGLHDVHGNVWEWVEDCWHGNYRGAPSDGSAWISGGDCGVHVMRGGGWTDIHPAYLLFAHRNGSTSGNRKHYGLGFRVARTLIATSRRTEEPEPRERETRERVELKLDADMLSPDARNAVRRWPAARKADPAWEWARVLVFLVQSALVAQGYDPGEPDGLMGPKTMLALIAWSAASGPQLNGKTKYSFISGLDGNVAHLLHGTLEAMGLSPGPKGQLLGPESVTALEGWDGTFRRAAMFGPINPEETRQIVMNELGAGAGSQSADSQGSSR